MSFWVKAGIPPAILMGEEAFAFRRPASSAAASGFKSLSRGSDVSMIVQQLRGYSSF